MGLGARNLAKTGYQRFCHAFLPKSEKIRKIEKIWSLGKKLKNALEHFLRHMFLVFVSQHVWGGVGNLTWPPQGLRGEYECKNPMYTRNVTLLPPCNPEIPV